MHTIAAGRRSMLRLPILCFGHTNKCDKKTWAKQDDFFMAFDLRPMEGATCLSDHHDLALSMITRHAHSQLAALEPLKTKKNKRPLRECASARENKRWITWTHNSHHNSHAGMQLLVTACRLFLPFRTSQTHPRYESPR